MIPHIWIIIPLNDVCVLFIILLGLVLNWVDINSALSENDGIPNYTLYSTWNIITPANFPFTLLYSTQGFSCDRYIYKTAMWCERYDNYQCKPDSVIPNKGRISCNMVSFWNVGSRGAFIITLHSSSIVLFTYACLISQVNDLTSVDEASREIIVLRAKWLTVDSLFAIILARLSQWFWAISLFFSNPPLSIFQLIHKAGS